MRVVVLEQCDANADDRERRRALFLGQTYELTEEEAAPLLAAGTVRREGAEPPTAPTIEPVDEAEAEVEVAADALYPCPHNCGKGPWKTEKGRDGHVDKKH